MTLPQLSVRRAGLHVLRALGNAAAPEERRFREPSSTGNFTWFTQIILISSIQQRPRRESRPRGRRLRRRWLPRQRLRRMRRPMGRQLRIKRCPRQRPKRGPKGVAASTGAATTAAAQAGLKSSVTQEGAELAATAQTEEPVERCGSRSALRSTRKGSGRFGTHCESGGVKQVGAGRGSQVSLFAVKPRRFAAASIWRPRVIWR